MKTCFSLFSGCGGSDVGMVDAGYNAIGGIEYHQPAADIYNANHLNPLNVTDVLDVGRIPNVDLLWASPPCLSFSIANKDRGETDRDIRLAKHIAMLMIESRPRSIAIENVRDYRRSQSRKIITEALENQGYTIAMSVENAANYGTPSTRERLIIRASLDGLNQLHHTHTSNPKYMPLFPLPTWISWWDAIADRIEELPRSQLTDKQKSALEKQGFLAPLLVDGAGNNYNSSYTTRTHYHPAHTITATIAKHPIRVLIDLNNPRGGSYTSLTEDKPAHTITAGSGIKYNFATKILIDRVGYYGGTPKHYPHTIPAPTIRSSPSIDDKGCYRVSHNIWDGIDCLAADIRCLAAWQGFPKDYQWGDNKGEAGRAIGNAVPPALSKAVALSFN